MNSRLPESVLLRKQRFGGRREPTPVGRHDVREAVRPCRDPGRPFLCRPPARRHFAAALTLAYGGARLAGVYCACKTAIGRASNKSATGRLGPGSGLPAASTLRIPENPSTNTDAFQGSLGCHRRPSCVARPKSRPLTTTTAFRSP